MATAEFSKSAGVLSATVSQHHLLGFEIAQLVKYLSAMPETLIRSLGWKVPLEEGMAAHSRILA